MASIGNDPNGRKRILFVAGDGTRKTIRLGKMDRKNAERFCGRVEKIIGANISGGALDDETSRWLAERDDATHARMAAVGLVKPRKTSGTTLKQLLDSFFKHLTVKPITSLGYQATRAALLAEFGAETPIRDIEPLQADQWRAKMKADDYAEATLSKRVKLARQIFRQAVRWKMLSENPFEGVKAGSQQNRSRQYFLTREDAQKVLDKCPDPQWKLLFTLSRYGGLRCPSEHLALTWADVDWEHGRIRVTCSKTEHHEGRGERFMPIFPELRPYLLEVFERAEPGTTYVISRYRNANANLRTQLQRIIRKAGLTPWPRLFHNLRSTRQTELAESFPSHVVCAWIGNTERVAQNHYLQVTDAHFERANAEPASSAAQNPAQSTAVSGSKGREVAEAKNENRPYLLSDTEQSRYLLNSQVAPTGLEPVTRGL